MKNKNRIMVVVTSLCFCFVFAFSGLDVMATEHVRGDSIVVDIESSYSYSNFNYITSNMYLPIDNYTDEDFTGVTNYSYFYRFFDHQFLIDTSVDVYGYRISIVASNASLTSEQCSSFYNAVGTYGEIVKNEAIYSGSPKYSNTCWYINNYRDVSLYLAQVGRFYSYTYSDMDDEASTGSASISLSGDYKVWLTPYTEEDLLDEIYSELGTLVGQNEQIMSQLDDILAENIDTNDKLTAMYDLLSTELDNIHDELAEQSAILGNINNNIFDIIDILQSQSSSDKNVVDDFSDNSDSQSNQLDDMNNQLAVNKPSSDTVSGDVDSNIDYDAIGVFGAVLSPFMGNQMIVKMMLIALSICLVSYIFFGKRG